MHTHAPPSYALGKCLYASKRTEVYAAIPSHDSRAVVLKAYVGSAADADANAQREFTTLRQFARPGIPVAVELLREDTRPIVVLEVAIQLADALARVHEKRLIHRDVTPQNVVVDPENLSTCLLDFSLARRLLRARDRESVPVGHGTAHVFVDVVESHTPGMPVPSTSGPGRLHPIRSAGRYR